MSMHELVFWFIYIYTYIHVCKEMFVDAYIHTFIPSYIHSDTEYARI